MMISPKSKERLHNIWKCMKSRCNNQNRHDYARYGGRGIRVCDEWNASFIRFVEWAMANGYQDDLELDRLDNDGPYCPDNCRWITHRDNTRNRSSAKHLTLCGTTKTISEWCEVLGIPKYTLYSWFSRYGEKGCAKRVYKRLSE